MRGIDEGGDFWWVKRFRELTDEEPEEGEEVLLVGFGLDACVDGESGERRYGNNEISDTSDEYLNVEADLDAGEALTWKGDSGGPMIWKNQLVGVLSLGNCFTSGTSTSWHTNVHTYSTWISNRIEEDACDSINRAPSAPIIIPPATPRAGERADVLVVMGSDSDDDQVKVQCTSAGSQYASNPYDSGFKGLGAEVDIPFAWSTSGNKVISCTTFDPQGASSQFQPRTISFTKECI